PLSCRLLFSCHYIVFPLFFFFVVLLFAVFLHESRWSLLAYALLLPFVAFVELFPTLFPMPFFVPVLWKFVFLIEQSPEHLQVYTAKFPHKRVGLSHVVTYFRNTLFLTALCRFPAASNHPSLFLVLFFAFVVFPYCSQVLSSPVSTVCPHRQADDT